LSNLRTQSAKPILENIGTLVAFRQGAGESVQDIAAIIWPRFTARDLQSLPDFHAAAKTTDPAGRPVRDRLRLPRPLWRRRRSDAAIRETSRRVIARPRQDVEAELLSCLKMHSAPH